MDPASISLLISSGMRLWADMSERNSAGTITDADIELMLTTLGHNAESWQAKIDAHKAAKV